MIIPQVEKQADKYVYSRLSLEVFRMVISSMAAKAKNPTGNKFMFICNLVGWQQAQVSMDKFLVDHKVDGNHLWSKEANSYVKVGATYDAYEWAGNIVQFHVDAALTREYPTKGYFLCLDLTADSTGELPPISLFTLRGGDCIINSVEGVNSTNCAA